MQRKKKRKNRNKQKDTRKANTTDSISNNSIKGEEYAVNDRGKCEAHRTNIDAFREAEKNTKHIEEDYEKKIKYFWQHAAVLFSLFSIFLMALLYAYDCGFYSVYKIPVNYSDIDLRRFLPLFIRIAGVFTCIAYYVGSLKYDLSQCNNRFKYQRLLWGNASLQLVLFQYISNVILSLIISFFVWVLIEGVLWFWMNNRIKEKELTSIEYKMKVEDYMADRFLFFYLSKPIVVALIFLLIAAPFFGVLVSTQKTKYETLTINNREFVIISMVGDSAYVEAYEKTDDSVIIHTDAYMRITINELAIKTVEFNNVKIE